MLSLCQLLAQNRCMRKDTKFVDAAGNHVAINWNNVFNMATNAFVQEYQTKTGRPIVRDITEACSFGPWAGAPPLATLNERLRAQLHQWTFQYLAKNDCLEIEQLFWFHDVAGAILTYAEAAPAP
jgi:hypothetical protein